MPKPTKPRLAILLPDFKLDRSGDSHNDRLAVTVCLLEDERPRNVSRISNFEQPIAMFDDLVLECTVSWYGGKWEVYDMHARYKSVYSVDHRNIDVFVRGLRTCRKAAAAFPITPATFGQYVALMAAGLGIKEMVRRSPRDPHRNERITFYGDATWQVLPISHVQSVIDESMEKARLSIFPETSEPGELAVCHG